MMKTLQSIFLITIICFLGCTSTYRLRPAQEQGFVSFNNRATQKRALVTFADSSQIQVENLRMTRDSTYWHVTNKIATDRIKEVRCRSLRGASKWSLDRNLEQPDLYATINDATRGRRAVLTLSAGLEWQVRQLWMTPDFTYWIDPQIKQQNSPTYIAVPTSQIKEIRFIDRGKGAIQGSAFGSLLGLIFGVSQTGEACADCFIPISAGEIVLGSAMLGAAFAMPIGAIAGHRDVYKIEHEKPAHTN